MVSQRNQLESLERLERLRIVRGVCLTLGIIALLAAVSSIGGIGVGNPESWASAFVAFRAAGHMRWLILPIGALGALLVAIGIGLTVYLTKQLRKQTGGKVSEL